MNDYINILQLNIRGIISLKTQMLKCQYLNEILVSKKIDIALLQEWCVTTRESVNPSENNSNTPKFPLKHFPDYNIHYHATECAILYHKDLSITPLSLPKGYETISHNNNFHICGITLHSGKADYSIYSV